MQGPRLTFLSELLLEAQYWSHIENFCMHFGGLPRKAIDDLILVFLHALGGQFSNSNFQATHKNLLDNLTSNSSTFPYTAAECEKFLKLLNSSKGRPLFPVQQNPDIRSHAAICF